MKHVIALALALTLGLPTLSSAEPSSPDSHEAMEDEGKQKKLMERIRLVRMYALTEALDLDEATAARLFPYLKAQDEVMKSLQDRKRQTRKALRKMVRKDSFPRGEVKALTRELASIEVERAEAEKRRLEGLREMLTPEQQVKCVMVREKLEREIMKIVREHRRKRMGEDRPGRRGPRGEGQRGRRGDN